MATNTFAPVKDGRLFYRLEGDTNLPVLMFSNSLGTTHSMWGQQVPAFSQQFRILRYDSRGHGASEVTSGDYTIEMLGRDVLALLDHLKISSACYCGISIGGVVGQWLGLNAGERFSKIVLSNTAARIGAPESWNARIASVRQGGMKAISEAVVSRWFTEPFHRSHPETVERIRQALEATPAQGYVATCAAIREADFRASVGAIRSKTLVIAGTQDQATPAKDGHYLAEQIPGAQYLELDAAHLSSIELPGQFNAAIVKFLAS